MSGGHFDYDQYKIGHIADSIERLIEKSGLKKTKEELKDESWRGDDWYKKYPEDLYHYKYPDEVLEKFLGLPKYLREQNRSAKIGVIQGLAWNELGGDVLTIECVAIPNETPNYTGSIKYTGKLGEVMQESIQTAFSYLKSCKNIINIDDSSYKTYDIHVHVPEGGTPKDGPSAGITIFTVLASLLLKKKIRPDIAMTGEITLRGRVLAIGGLKEKILAAKRNDIKTILIPKENARELEEIQSELKEGLEIIMIENAIDSLQHAIINNEDGDIITIEKPTNVKKARKKIIKNDSI